MIYISPWIVSYIIATFLLLAGLQLLGVSKWFQKSSDSKEGNYKFGDYEIVRRKK